MLLRLFAPFLPFVTEEVWSWWHDGSVHRAAVADRGGAAGAHRRRRRIGALALERAALVLGEVRKTKSEAKRKLSTPVERLVVRDTAEHLAALRTAEADLVSSGFVQQLVTRCPTPSASRCRWRRRNRRRPARPPHDRSAPTAGSRALDDLIRRALAEDVGSGDVTTAATVRPTRGGAACCWRRPRSSWPGWTSRARSSRWSPARDVVFTPRVDDGDACQPGDVMAEVEGPAAALLTAERTALNLLQRLSGIATATRRFVDAAAGRITVLDTRKTTPTLRALEKYAVRVGGGTNHRFGLFDPFLIKDNHVRLAGGIGAAVAKARAASPGLPVEVEAQTVDEAAEAADAGADIVLLDNLSTPEIREAVADHRRTREDRGVRRRHARAHPGTGDDRRRFVSVGALTHSVQAADISLEIEPVAGCDRDRSRRRRTRGLAEGLEHAQAHGDPSPLGSRVLYFPVASSTNDLAARLALQGTPDGTLVIAGQQTAGRGRGGHEWYSPPGAGLYVSAVLDAHQGTSADWVHALTLATGVAMAEGLHAASGLPVVIKWPNDLVMAPAGTVRGARKLAGILAEAQTDAGALSHVIVGVGVNVGPAAWPPEISSRATSLEEELGRPVDAAVVLGATLARHGDLGAAPARRAFRGRAHAVAATGRGRARRDRRDRPCRGPAPRRHVRHRRRRRPSRASRRRHRAGRRWRGDLAVTPDEYCRPSRRI